MVIGDGSDSRPGSLIERALKDTALDVAGVLICVAAVSYAAAYIQVHHDRNIDVEMQTPPQFIRVPVKLVNIPGTNLLQAQTFSGKPIQISHDELKNSEIIFKDAIGDETIQSLNVWACPTNNKPSGSQN